MFPSHSYPIIGIQEPGHDEEGNFMDGWDSESIQRIFSVEVDVEKWRDPERGTLSKFGCPL